MPQLNLPPNLTSKINVRENGCWEWTASRTPGGYGITWDPLRKRTCVVHRYIYGLLRSVVPEGMYCDHLCRVRHCVNPDHIEIVTHRENTMRGENFVVAKAQQTHCIHGHEFTPENTARNPSGTRRCRACARLRLRETHRRRVARS